MEGEKEALEMAEVFFDGTFRLRVLEEEKYKDTERLAEEATSFTSKMGQFQDTVQKLVEGMNRHASRIESAKLKALGQRNRVESEKEVRGGGPLHSQGTCFPR
mmetsp:Transcript_491/g.1138  ORF Transcript_491/g.1138 Transcript_491/m.1138 type:complete len:103 (-) Transcript_491:2015-2323(-)